MTAKHLCSIISAAALCSALSAHAETIGEVNTAFKILGSDKIAVEVFDDPKAKGVACYVSKAKTGGLSGTLGLATDSSDASIACRQVADRVELAPGTPDQEEVFSESRSILFKKLRVVRILDRKRSAIVYLTYSDKLVDWSPKNSVTAVALTPGQIPERRK